MPELFDQVLARRPVEFVLDVQGSIAPKFDSTLVREAAIAARSDGPVPLRRAGDLEQPHLRLVEPAKRAGRRGLVLPINANRVVRRGTAKDVSPFGIKIAVGAGID